MGWFGVKEVQLLACHFEVPAVHLEGTIHWRVDCSILSIYETSRLGSGHLGDTSM